MRRRLLLMVGVVGATVAVPFGAHAADGEGCRLFAEHDAAVEPLRVTENITFERSDRLAGAEVYVPAQPGLTAEWLQRTVETDIAAGRCGFAVDSVGVDVSSAGNGFSVRLTARKLSDAQKILDRARQMARP